MSKQEEILRVALAIAPQLARMEVDQCIYTTASIPYVKLQGAVCEQLTARLFLVTDPELADKIQEFVDGLDGYVKRADRIRMN